ncbi:hypothetical protein BSP14_229 [Bacillus phage BSP14]|nr:hypothetical protein BSP14_229 [Bacillus phage BSP14]
MFEGKTVKSMRIETVSPDPEEGERVVITFTDGEELLIYTPVAPLAFFSKDSESLRTTWINPKNIR